VKPTPKPAPELKPESRPELKPKREPKPDFLPVTAEKVSEIKEKILRPKKKKQRVKGFETGPRTKSTPKPAPASKPKPKPKPDPEPKPKPDPLQIKAEKKGCQNEISVGMPELCDE
jgi:hypothetical protein